MMGVAGYRRYNQRAGGKQSSQRPVTQRGGPTIPRSHRSEPAGSGSGALGAVQGRGRMEELLRSPGGTEGSGPV